MRRGSTPIGFAALGPVEVESLGGGGHWVVVAAVVDRGAEAGLRAATARAGMEDAAAAAAAVAAFALLPVPTRAGAPWFPTSAAGAPVVGTASSCGSCYRREANYLLYYYYKKKIRY